jgi:hypothetical protein
VPQLEEEWGIVIDRDRKSQNRSIVIKQHLLEPKEESTSLFARHTNGASAGNARGFFDQIDDAEHYDDDDEILH